MKVLIDLNVLLDVVQKRVPYQLESAEVVSRARTREFEAAIPAHAVTTLHYIVAKSAGQPKADQTVDWLLEHFEVAAADASAFRRARQLALGDFEDAVVAAVAEGLCCDHVVTRNTADFRSSPVPAVSPAKLLELLGSGPRRASGGVSDPV